MPPQDADVFKSMLGAVKTAVDSGVCPNYAATKRRHWRMWLAYCGRFCIDPYLRNTVDPIPLLQVFAALYRDGTIAPRKKPVKSASVSDTVLSVG